MQKLTLMALLQEKGIGDRFEAVSHILQTISRLISSNSSATDDSVDPTPFAYLFTKYDIKYANRLCKQFAAKYKQLNAKEKADITFSAFII